MANSTYFGLMLLSFSNHVVGHPAEPTCKDSTEMDIKACANVKAESGCNVFLVN